MTAAILFNIREDSYTTHHRELLYTSLWYTTVNHLQDTYHQSINHIDHKTTANPIGHYMGDRVAVMNIFSVIKMYASSRRGGLKNFNLHKDSILYDDTDFIFLFNHKAPKVYTTINNSHNNVKKKIQNY